MVGSSLGEEAAGNLVFEFRPKNRPFCCIVGKGDQPISGETEDVVLEVTFKETAEFSFASGKNFDPLDWEKPYQVVKEIYLQAIDFENFVTDTSCFFWK